MFASVCMRVSTYILCLKVHAFYFYYYSAKCLPILTISNSIVAEEIYNQMTYYFPIISSLCTNITEWKYKITDATNSVLEPPFEGVRGNVRTSSIARWKARG